MVEYTISCHNGHTVRREHNRRNRKVTDREKHIRRDGYYETWLDIRPQDVYAELFGEAIADYNYSQELSGHPERRIKDYYRKICDDKQKHPVYEMIVSVGNMTNHPSVATSRQILKEFFNSWSERNPNLIMIGAYFHADEAADEETVYEKEGSTPHVHIDYIPVCHHQKRGPETQTALKKALLEMGIEPGATMKETAQIIWEHKQREYLENLCTKHGLNISHPKIAAVQHLDTKEYKQRKRILRLQDEKNKIISELDNLEIRRQQLERDYQSLEEDNLDLAQAMLYEDGQYNRGCKSR